MVSDTITRPKEDFQPPTLKHHLSEPDPLSNSHNDQTPHGTVLNTEDSSGNWQQNNVLDIMKRLNEITTILIQQQQRSSLPRRDIQVFDGDPLQYHTFMRAIEHGVENKSDSYGDCLYFLEQFTRGQGIL